MQKTYLARKLGDEHNIDSSHRVQKLTKSFQGIPHHFLLLALGHPLIHLPPFLPETIYSIPVSKLSRGNGQSAQQDS